MRTVIVGEYGISSVEMDATPRKSDAAFAEERAADRVSLAAIKRLHGWSDAEFEQAQGEFNYPKAIGITHNWRGVVGHVYSRSADAAWTAKMRAFFATL